MAGLHIEDDVSAPRWRDCTDHAKALLAHMGLARSADHHGFTLRLSDEVERQARGATKGPMDYLRRRIADQLRKVLGPDVRWWACLEETPDQALHLHGEIECPSERLDDLRRALRLAGGEWAKKGRQYQVRIETRPDVRWSSYCAKGLYLATKARRELMARFGCTNPRYVASFPGPAFTMSNALRVEAKAALEELSDLRRETNHESSAAASSSCSDVSDRSGRSIWWTRALQPLLQNAATKCLSGSSQAIENKRSIVSIEEFNPLSQHHSKSISNVRAAT